MQAFISLMALGIVVLDIAIVVCVIALFSTKLRGTIRSFAQSYGLLAIFLLSAGSIFGTLLMQYAAASRTVRFCAGGSDLHVSGRAHISDRARKRQTNVGYRGLCDRIRHPGCAISLYQHLLQVPSIRLPHPL